MFKTTYLCTVENRKIYYTIFNIMTQYIFLKDNVFVYSGELIPKTRPSLESNPSLVAMFLFSYQSAVSLFGGRIMIRKAADSNTCILSVDGIPIRMVVTDGQGGHLDTELALSQVTAYLNQMQNLGIDTFLTNYKQAVLEFKTETQELACKLEQELALNADDAKSQLLNSLRSIICDLMSILFALKVSMNAGLDNYVYVDAFESIKHLLQ